MDYGENEKTVNTRSMVPAEGERRAIGGYYPQYRIAAFLILRGLRDGSLRWIRVADPEAGRVDDLQIGSHSLVDAFQIKWSRYGGNFSFNDLVRGSADKPSLIAQLADGWVRLRRAHSGDRVVVHLITNQGASVSDRLPVGDLPPTPRHFAAFLEQVWKPAQAASPGSGWDVSTSWEPAWDALRAASELSATEFKLFIENCELQFGFQLPGFETTTARDQHAAQADLQQITQFLFAVVADPNRLINLTRDQLLARLGWKGRFEYRSRHEFPVDEVLYHPVEPSVRKLEQALLNLTGGYIAVIGTPGSGKSTLLTRTLHAREERVIRYYAYVPDAQDPLTLRGESTNFFHDVVMNIERAGFKVGESSLRFDRDELMDRFHRQLQLLHHDWRSSGRKTVILIDGLDHIVREQHPNRSLLLDLPQPEQVPEGIYFVLGSQTDAPFPDRVQAAVRQSDRRIEMQPLGRESVFLLVDRAGLRGVHSSEQKEQIYAVSGGHPLALTYLLNRLREAIDTNDIEALLQTEERYQESIEGQYHSYWRQIEDDDEVAHALGLLARLRREIDISWVETWLGHSVVSRLRRLFGHYFKREDHNRWYFFHNSFRLFLINKTAESSPGVFDLSRDRAVHIELAEKCARTSIASPWSWEELYHRVLAGQHDLILERANIEWFREQVLAFRPIDAIEADITLALRASQVREDQIARNRLMRALQEMAQCKTNFQCSLGDSLMVELLLGLGEELIAVEHVRDGNCLRPGLLGSRGDVFGVSRTLRSAGLSQEARRVFELAEPLVFLHEPKHFMQHLGIEHLFAAPVQIGKYLAEWARSAVHFKDVEEIITAARRVFQGAAERFKAIGAEFEEKTFRCIGNQMLFDAGHELLKEQRWEDLEKVSMAFDLRREDQGWWFWLQARSWNDRAEAKDWARARDFLEQAMQRIDALDLSPEMHVGLAEATFLILQDEEAAREWLQDVRQPKFDEDSGRFDPKYPLDARFALYRMLYALEDQRPPAEIIPDLHESEHQWEIYFERALCAVAHLCAEAWRGHSLGSSTVVIDALSALSLCFLEDRSVLKGIYTQTKTFLDLCVALVDASAQHGYEAIQVVRDTVEREWSENAIRWPTDFKRQVILALLRAGVPRDWVIQRLQAVEGEIRDGIDLSGWIPEGGQQAKAWLAVGEQESARRLLKEMLHRAVRQAASIS